MKLSLILETNLALIANKLSIPQDKLQELLTNADPTNGKYKDYIIKLLLNKNIRLPEDNHRVRETLSLFHAHKNRLPVKDINRYKSLHELETAVEQYQGTASKRQGGLEINPLSLPGVEVYHKQGKYTTLKITNANSLAEIGEGTKWCTRKSYPDCQAKEYINDYKYIYTVFDGNKPIMQYTPDYTQIMDRNDEEIQDKELLQKLIPKPPLNINLRYIYFYAKKVLGSRWPEAEKIIIKNLFEPDVTKGHWNTMDVAYQYAKHIIGNRWLEIEPIIASDTSYSIKYAHNLIGHRWHEAEKTLLDSVKNKEISPTELVYYYHMFIASDPSVVARARKNTNELFNDRWYEAEPYIIKSQQAIIRYMTIINTQIRPFKRWPEAEQHIAKFPEASVWYAINMLGERFKQGEDVIGCYPSHSAKYKKAFPDFERQPWQIQ